MHGKVEEVIFTLCFLALSLFNSIFKMNVSMPVLSPSAIWFPYLNLINILVKKYVLSSLMLLSNFAFKFVTIVIM